ncbi:MAG: hypothetical protein PF488_01300 [Patescibacteria group bacterium]|jgi:hypothetical protein|nr:hypothetical protein [Patescibacteria group bacterium]
MEESFKEKFQDYWFATTGIMILVGIGMLVISAIIKMLFEVIMIDPQMDWLVLVAILGLLILFLPILFLEFLIPSKILDFGRFGKKTTVISRLLFVFLLPFTNFSFITFLSKGLDIIVNEDHFLTKIYSSISLHFYFAVGSFISLILIGFLYRFIIYLFNRNKEEDLIRVIHINHETDDVDR